MKRVINFLVGGAIVLSGHVLMAQTADEARMNRDIEIAENVLSTLIKQEMKASFFPVDVKGTYRSGYGVTFTVPSNMFFPMGYGGKNEFIFLDGTPGAYTYSFSTGSDEEEEMVELERGNAQLQKTKSEKEKVNAEKEKVKADKEKVKAEQGKELAEKEKHAAPHKEDIEYGVARGARTRATRTVRDGDRDSLVAATNTKIIAAAKSFLADYGDMLSLLKGDEKIIITNKSNNQRWYAGQGAKRSVLIVEATKGDVTQYRQGKITREQLLAKIKVTNTESSGKLEPDLELLTSIFNRLYSSDLSTNYYINGNAYYERLNDYGAIVNMQVYSSNENGYKKWNMPTVDLQDLTQEERDKKVKELYPAFESELKENILEYGRTVRSLKDNEQLVFNVTLTKCKGCGIPADLEVSVPYSVLKDYNAGKLDKNGALGKVTVKKGAAQ